MIPTMFRDLQRDVMLIMASRGIRAFAFSYLNVVFAIYLDRLGYSTVMVGVIFSVAYLSGAVLTAVWGLLSDRFGRRNILILLAVLTIVSNAIYIFFSGLVFILLAVVIANVGAGGSAGGGQGGGPFNPVEQALLAEKCSPEKRNRIFAVNSFVGSIMGSIGALASGLPQHLQENWGWEPVMSYKPLFALTLLWAAWSGWSYGGNLGGALFAILAICLLFGGVLLHELAHTQQAQAAGIAVRRITLLPIGGLAELRALPDNPKIEFTIAIAGPLANLGLAFMFAGLVLLVGGRGASSTYLHLMTLAASPTLLGLLVYLMGANLALFAFNLLPIYPLDGGRILHSLLALLFSPRAAARFAGWVGRILALGLGAVAVFGLGSSPTLVLLAIFLFLSSSVEAAAFDQRRRLQGAQVNSALPAQHVSTWTISPGDLLEEVLESGVFELQAVAPVVVENRLVGMLTQADGRRGLQRSGITRVAHVMRTQFPRLQGDDSLWVAQQSLLSSGLQALPVLDNGSLHGLLTRRDVYALGHRQGQRRPAGLGSRLVIPLGRRRRAP